MIFSEEQCDDSFPAKVISEAVGFELAMISTGSLIVSVWQPDSDDAIQRVVFSVIIEVVKVSPEFNSANKFPFNSASYHLTFISVGETVPIKSIVSPIQIFAGKLLSSVGNGGVFIISYNLNSVPASAETV